MEVVKIQKQANNQIRMTVKEKGRVRPFVFTYFDNELFGVDFPEELRELLRPLPASITQTVVKAIKQVVRDEIVRLPLFLNAQKREKIPQTV